MIEKAWPSKYYDENGRYRERKEPMPILLATAIVVVVFAVAWVVL